MSEPEIGRAKPADLRLGLVPRMREQGYREDAVEARRA